MEQGLFEGVEVISTYTRAQAIEDGVLKDITETAQEAGFKYPVAITGTAWGQYIVPTEAARKWGQTEEGRLWDVVSMLMFHIKRTGGRADIVLFQVYFIMKEKLKRLVTLKAICGPGDDGEPVITIMLPDED